jgi:threonine dehydrogenase-like Zn-dependent dehydrogenase
MRALFLDRKTGVRFVPDYPTPEPGADEALIRVVRAGICNTDLELIRGYYGYQGVLGHEFVGVVEESPDPSWVGRRVVGEINITCGKCDMCRRGMPTHCRNRTVLGILGKDGSFADYVTLPLRNLHAVPDSIPDEVAAFTEPLAAALEILEQVNVAPGERVVVVGAGKLGLLIAQVLAKAGADLTVGIRTPRRNRTLLQQWGIDVRSVDRIPRGMADKVVDATGTPEGFALARSFVRPRGTLVLKSTYHGKMQVDMTSVVVDEITIVGSRCGPFHKALDWLKRGDVDVLSMLDAVFPLERGVEALEMAARPGTLKVALEVS